MARRLPKVEVEQALVEAEMESEVAGLQQEKEALEALRRKMADLEAASQQEKQKVHQDAAGRALYPLFGVCTENR